MGSRKENPWVINEVEPCHGARERNSVDQILQQRGLGSPPYQSYDYLRTELLARGWRGLPKPFPKAVLQRCWLSLPWLRS